MARNSLKLAPKGKERELLTRDELYFEIARRIFLEEGFHALTLGRIAEDTGFSRATVYERFGCKENLIAELGIQCGRELLGVMEGALEFSGRARERMFAVGESISNAPQLFVCNMRILRTIDAETVFPRVSPALQAQMSAVKDRAFALLLRPIEEAVAAGDLKLDPDEKPQALCFTLWTMVDGWAAAVTGGAPLGAMSLADPLTAVRQHIRYLFDGVGWRPLSCEWDYDETARRIRLKLCEQTI
jgi:AcrR family transcriptional regulator